MINPLTIDKLAAIDDKSWGVIYKELVRYADFKLNKFGFEIRTEKDTVDAEYFATLAIEKLFDGTRAWDFERYPDVKIHLIGVVKSLLSSHFKSSKRSIVSAGQIAQENIEQLVQIELSDSDERSSESPEELYINNEQWELIEDAFGDNKDDYTIFCLWLDDIPPREISSELELSVQEVNNALKRGMRIVKNKFKKQL